MADKYLLEDGSGGYQLEDGSGNLLLEQQGSSVQGAVATIYLEFIANTLGGMNGASS